MVERTLHLAPLGVIVVVSYLTGALILGIVIGRLLRVPPTTQTVVEAQWRRLLDRLDEDGIDFLINEYQASLRAAAAVGWKMRMAQCSERIEDLVEELDTRINGARLPF